VLALLTTLAIDPQLAVVSVRESTSLGKAFMRWAKASS